MEEHPFQSFLHQFIPAVSQKSTQVNKASWILETTGSSDAADLKAQLDTELRLLFNDPHIYQQLLVWDKDPSLKDPLLKRQLNVLLRTFKQNLIPKDLLEQIAQKEAALAISYGSFRPEYNGKLVSENDIRELLKSELNVERRKEAWEASKKIGAILAPKILELVKLRNLAAKTLGYRDYFQMQLDLQEVDAKWLLKTLEDLGEQSNTAYLEILSEINGSLSNKFKVPLSELGPWAWSEPFCQEDPLNNQELDSILDGVNILKSTTNFYQRLGIDVEEILQRSDMYERPGKNQHAFCIHIDREGDIRTLNNVRSSLKWLETVLHEIGHAVYELGFDENLPWLLREPPHMIPTEAMALIAGRQAYRHNSLHFLVGGGSNKESLLQKVEKSLKRRELIFSRWVLTMTAFESELYRDPSQELNQLWWHLVEKYQKITPPPKREHAFDWACKYHIGLAPAYYFSYLLGEMFASAIQEALVRQCGDELLSSPAAGHFLQEKLFKPGNRMSWYELVCHVTGGPLTGDAWVKEFC